MADEWMNAWQVQEAKKHKDLGLQSSLAFCAMIWLEFMWTEKVNVGVSEKRGPQYSTLNSRIIIKGPHNRLPLIFGNSYVNGKQHRLYATLRSELRAVMRAAKVKISASSMPSLLG